MKSIGVNNGRQLRIEGTPQGVMIAKIDAAGATESRETIPDGEIVALYNLVHYMKRQGVKRVFIETPDGPEEFPIIQ